MYEAHQQTCVPYNDTCSVAICSTRALPANRRVGGGAFARSTEQYQQAYDKLH